MKILIIVLSSPSVNNVYKLHKEVWLKYMNSNKNIDCFFLEYNSNEDYTKENVIIKDNHIFINGTESQSPGCRDKTFDIFNYILKLKNNTHENLKPLYQYNFVIRTNLSSLWNFKALIKYLETLPNKSVYSGVIGHCSQKHIDFASGAGIIMTPDIVELIIQNKNYAYECNYQDDVEIGFILKKLNIIPSPSSRTDIYSKNMYQSFVFNENIYHYRIKWDNPALRHEEYEVMLNILNCM